MEDKKLNEQESLELISQMINQTKKESAAGSGDVYLVWGYVCTLISLAVYALAYISRNGSWGCLAAVFAVYMVVCFASWNHPDCWKGMFLLGLLLPGLGTACTGVILKEKIIALCGGIGAASGLIFLPKTL